MPIFDATALDVLKRIDMRCRKHHIMLMLTELQPQPRKLLDKTGFVDKLGEERLFEKYEDAFELARSIVEFKNKTAKNRNKKQMQNK